MPAPLPPSPLLRATDLFALALAAGADDAALVRLDDPALDEDRPFILAAMPHAKTLLVLVARMNREAVRSPQRSIANLEFHQTGEQLDHAARQIVRQLEDQGVPALNPAMAFPMEMEQFPKRMWIVSHKRAAEAAGLGRIGLHRNLIHPRYGSFVLLNTLLLGVDVDQVGTPLAENPCFECKLCVAACPVGAIKPDGYFDFSTCFTHNYQQFMGGFATWIEDVVESKNRADYHRRVPYAETVTRWQSLSYKPNYNAAYCVAVCPAGTEVIPPYQQDKADHLRRVVKPLQDKPETLYVVKGSDAAQSVPKRFPHKTIRWVRQPLRVETIEIFLRGLPLLFQPGQAGSLDATYHFTFTGREPQHATIILRNRRVTCQPGHHGQPTLRVTADSVSWCRFLNKELSIPKAILTGRIRLKGSPKWMIAFAKCFPV